MKGTSVAFMYHPLAKRMFVDAQDLALVLHKAGHAAIANELEKLSNESYKEIVGQK